MQKAREKFCPRCGEDITDSYAEIDEGKGVGVTSLGYYCDACELPVPEEDNVDWDALAEKRLEQS